MYHGLIDIPTFAYFEFGNTWTGSLLFDMNYRIEPRSKEQPPCLQVAVWYGRSCLEKSEPAEQFSEPLSQEGYENVVSRINEIAKDYRLHRTKIGTFTA